MAFGDADVTMLLGDVFSEPVVYGTGGAAVACRGVFTRVMAPVLDTDGFAAERLQQTVEVPIAALPAVAPDVAITVGGRPYRTRLAEPVEDGRVLRIHLAG